VVVVVDLLVLALVAMAVQAVVVVQLTLQLHLVERQQLAKEMLVVATVDLRQLHTQQAVVVVLVRQDLMHLQVL
jgi:hypothetical protein